MHDRRLRWARAILSFPYLYFVRQENLALAFLFAMLMWGVVYQGYNAVFPASTRSCSRPRRG